MTTSQYYLTVTASVDDQRGQLSQNAEIFHQGLKNVEECFHRIFQIVDVVKGQNDPFENRIVEDNGQAEEK